jgi:F0F1-type ATP synthase assembly protein I
MTDMDPRRLAAVDMYGTRGTLRRRRIILFEFVVGLIATLAFGGWLISVGGVRNVVIGIIVMTIGLNYAPLAVYAMRFSTAGALEAELSDVDVPNELRRYAVLQLWVFVPLALVFLAVRRRPA